MAGRADIQAGRAFVTLYAKTSEFAHGIVNAENRLKSFAIGTERLGNILQAIDPVNLYQKLGAAVEDIGHRITAIGNSTVRMGGSLAISSAAMSLAFLKPVKDASDLEETLNKFRVVFGPQTDAVLEWGNAYAAAVGRSRQETAAFLAGAQDLFIPLGFAASEAEGMSKQITQLAFDLASFNNMQDADAMRDLQAALTGSGETMKKYGVVLTENAVKQKLWSDGIDPEKATEQQKVLARWSIIIGGTAAAQGDAIRTAGGWANQTKALFGTLKDLSASVGQALLPVLTPMLTKVNEVVKALTAWTVANQETIRGIAKFTIARVGIGVAMAAIGTSLAGVGLIGIGPAVSMFGKLMEVVGGLGKVLKPVMIGMRVITSLFGAGTVLSFASSLASLVMSFVSVGGIASAVGSVISFLAPIFLTLAAVTAAVVAGFVSLVAGIVGGVAAFVYLAKPVSALLPLFKSVMDSIGSVVAAITNGDWQGAADAAIEGLRQAVARGVLAIMTMIRNSMTRLPAMLKSVLSGTGGAFTFLTDNLRKAFDEIWPTIQLSMLAFVAFYRDVMDQLPHIAGYVGGRLIRAFTQAFIAVHKWAWSAFLGVAKGILNAFTGFGPKLLKAIFTGGDIGALVQDFSRTIFLGAGIVEGLAGSSIAGFTPSPETKAAWESLEKSIAGAKAESQAESVISGGMSGGSGPVGSGGAAKKGGVASAFDRAPSEKYRAELGKLKADLDSGAISTEQFADGLAQLRKDTLGVEATKLDQFSARVQLLGMALQDGTIDLATWRSETQKAQQDILGIDPEPLASFQERLDLLFSAMRNGSISQGQFVAELGQARQEILGIDPAPLEQLRQRVELLDAAKASFVITEQQYTDAVKLAKEETLGLQPQPLQAFQERVSLLTNAMREGRISQAEWSESIRTAKEETLGIDATPIQQFGNRVSELRTQLQAGAISQAEFGREFKKTQQEFLGLDPTPIQTYQARIKELRESLSAGLITPDMFNAAAMEAIPADVKRIIEDTRTPLEKYRKEMSDLKKLRDTGMINDELFQRKSLQLSQQLPQTPTLATYSASALAASGQTGASVQDRMLKELQEQRKAAKDQLEEARAARRATERLADGMTAR